MSRQRYPEEFKIEAVKQVTEKGKPVADAHATSASIASVVKSGQLSMADIAVPALTAMNSNTLAKCVLAWISGGEKLAAYVIVGQLAIITSMWAGLLFQ